MLMLSGQVTKRSTMLWQIETWYDTACVGERSR